MKAVLGILVLVGAIFAPRFWQRMAILLIGAALLSTSVFAQTSEPKHYVWVLVTTYYCADQTGDFTCAPARGLDGVLVPPSQRIANETKGDYFASAAGCEAAVVKAREDHEATERHLRDRNITDYLRNAHVGCERHPVSP